MTSRPSIPWRWKILQELALLSSVDAQLAWQQRVSYDVVPELFCGWSDDTYHSDCDYSDEFSPVELKALAVFNGVFRRLVPALPRDVQGVEDLVRDPNWLAVVDSARMTLRVLSINEPDRNVDSTRP